MKYIKGYDGLRAYSILLVVVTHLGIFELLPYNKFVYERVWLLFSGQTGVQVFFSLSGFLITGILLKERTAHHTINLKNFYIRRFIRLLPPLVIFYIAVAILMYLKKIAATSVGLVMAVTYVYNFVPIKHYTGELGHMWSLSVEEQFYLFWPILLLFVASARKLYVLIGCIVAACFAAFYILPGIAVNGGATLGETYLTTRWLIPAVAPIMIGSGFAILAHYNFEKLSVSVHSNKAILLAALLLYICPLFLPEVLIACHSVFVAFGVCLFLLWIYFNQQSGITSVLERQPLIYIGKISYGIYVYQGFFLRTGSAESSMAVQSFPLNLVLTIVVAIISYEFFEKRVLKLKDKFR